MKTRIHYYAIGGVDSDSGPYRELVATIKADQPEARGHWMKAMADPEKGTRLKPHGTVEEIEIETQHLFDNQWNATKERVFDWYEASKWNGQREITNHREGHWVEITPEMAELRLSTNKCNWCGALYGPKHDTPQGAFCLKCLGGAYLAEHEIDRVRISPMAVRGPHDTGNMYQYSRDCRVCQEAEKAKVIGMTGEERAYLLPLYVKAQIWLADGDVAPVLEALEKRRDKDLAQAENPEDIRRAEVEWSAKYWLASRGMKVDNIIYYRHTGIFCFGWQGKDGISPSVRAELIPLLEGFPYPYEMATKKNK